MDFRIEKTNPNVTNIRMDNVKAGWEQWFMLRSDTHHDSVFCNEALEKKHLDKAVERKAGIIDAGDIFDAMQGREDRRRLRSELKMQLSDEDAYFDALPRDLAEFYKPYARNFCVIGMGNHETSVLKHSQTNLIKRLVGELKQRDDKAQLVASGYNGWIRFHFTANKTKRKSVTLYYDHGKGAGGPVTRGVIQTNRMSVYIPDAEIVLSGHTHDAWHVPIKKLRLSQGGNVTSEIQHHIKTPTYKDPWLADAEYGFDIEKGTPKPLGCYWIRFFYDSEEIINFEVIPDIS